MKIYLLSLLALMHSITSNAQDDIIKKGSLTLNPGIGIGSAWSNYGNKVNVPPLSVSLDIGVAPDITIGPYVAYSSTTEPDAFYGDFTYTHLLIGAKGAYHFNISDKFTGHAGGILGYHVISVSNSSAAAKASTVLYDFLIGATYHFTSKMGVFAELGYGITYLNIGASFSIK